MSKNNGFTLIEVLIAMIVLAVGLLGLASLQITGLSNNQGSYNRSQAIQLAYDIADRMRTNNTYNPATGKSYADNYLYSFMKPSSAACGNGQDTCSDCGSPSKSCTPAKLAEKDLYDWNRNLNNALPQTPGRKVNMGEITKSGSLYTVTIRWDEDRNGKIEAEIDPNFKLSFRL